MWFGGVLLKKFKLEVCKFLNLHVFLNLLSNRTSTVTLSNRSPVLQAVMPSPTENSQWLFNRRGENLKEFTKQNAQRKIEEEKFQEDFELLTEIGIIGQPIKLFHVKTLMARGNNDEDPNMDAKELVAIILNILFNLIIF